jgi:hypothetical protein
MIPCFERQSRFILMVDLMKKWDIQSWCALPLTTVHRRPRVLLLGSDEAEGYSQADSCFLALAADQSASAIDYAMNFRAYQVA